MKSGTEEYKRKKARKNDGKTKKKHHRNHTAEKSNRQRRMLDEWEYPSRYIDDAEENLRCATRELRDEIEKIQNVMAKEGNKRE